MILLPELYMLFYSIFFLLFALSKHKEVVVKYAKGLSLIGLILTFFSIGARGELFEGAYSVDLFSQIFKVLISLGLCFVMFMTEGREDTDKEYLPEFCMFLGLSTLGLMMLVSSVELISIVISLEISSYSLYVIIPLRKGLKRIQTEASMKYLFFGAVSTGLMLYGMGYIYGITRSTFLSDIIKTLPYFMDQPIAILALTLTLAGFLFKLSLFPFHFWAPDIYEGASNTTTSFIATVPKVAAVALLIRITQFAVPCYPGFLQILMILAALSMTFGNLVGLVQKDLKRLLAYSGIAHAGYIMIGIIALGREGWAATIFYITAYLLMNLACFQVIILLSKHGKNVTLDDLAGLSKRAPLAAFTLAVAAFSLAGIPPTCGFAAKLFVFTSAFRQGYLPIVIIGAVNTVISIFYYLNLVRMSYSKERVVVEPMHMTFSEKVLCYAYICLILFLGIMPYGFMEILRIAIG